MKKFINILILLLITISIYAQENSYVLVTADRINSSSKELTQSITILDEEEIKSYGVRTVAELFEQLNVGHIHEYPGASTSIAIRGFRSDAHGIDLRGHILILINGRRAGTGNLSKLLTKNIEKIEIIKGPAGIQYGSAAMGGVVNIITKKGNKNKILFISQYVGSFNYKESNIGGSGKINNFDYSFALTERVRDDYDTYKGKYENTDYGLSNYSFNLGYTFKNQRIGIIAQKFNGYDIGYTNQFDYNQNYTDNKAIKKLKSLDINYDYITDNIQLKIKLFKGKDENNYYDPLKNDYFGSPLESKNTTDFKGLQTTAGIKFHNFNLIIGGDYNYYETKNRNSDDIAPYYPDSEYKDLAFFLIPKIYLLNNKLTISAGARFDKFKLQINETPLRSDVKSKDETFNHITKSIGIAYQTNKYLKFRANYGEAFIIPQADQMNADYTFLWTNYKGNPDLDPEESKTYEAGIDINKKGINISYTYFYTKYKDKIETVNMGSYTTWENKGKAKLRGSEVNLSWDLGETFDLEFIIQPYLNFRYLDEFKDEENDEQLLYVSRLIGNYGIYFVTPENLTSIRINFAYTGEQNINYYDPSTWSTTKTKLKSFTVTTLNITQQIFNSENFGNLKANFKINNLFDKKYEYVKGYPMPERNYIIGLKYSYEF